MAGTYRQCYVHLIFAVKNREALIRKDWKDELEMYITGIVQKHEHKLLAIYAMPDHIHIFIGYNPIHLIPDLVEEIKTSSNAWIKREKLTNHKFSWQKGYGAFTHSHRQLNTVIHYIDSQENHHRKKTFREEYVEFLIRNDIKFNEKYLFDFFGTILE